jgi:hypothetical protein
VDSYVLFKKLAKNDCLFEDGGINLKKIKKIIDGTDFWGRFVLANPKHKRIYYYGDFKVTLLDEKCLIISSASISFDEYRNFWGFDFAINTPFKVSKGDFDGLLTMDLEKKTHKIKPIKDHDYSEYDWYLDKKDEQDKLDRNDFGKGLWHD